MCAYCTITNVEYKVVHDDNLNNIYDPQNDKNC